MDQTIQLIERRLEQLRAMIPLYKRKPPLEKWLASEIIDWQIRRNEYLYSQSTPVRSSVPTRVTTLVPNSEPTFDPQPDPIPEQNTMPGIYLDRAYWQPGQPVGVPARYFR